MLGFLQEDCLRFSQSQMLFRSLTVMDTDLGIRILIVDDYGPWRRFISTALHTNPHLRVVGEAPDGFAAIDKAAELQPDLVLLDIEMPKLNGIEAARKILQSSPQCKILFVSTEQSPEVASEAFRAGGLGYLAKPDAGNELFLAFETVLQGRRFASSSLNQRWNSKTA